MAFVEFHYHDEFLINIILLLLSCRLYRSLGDYDVLRGIFTGHIGTKSETQKALEAEARGDFSQALKLYHEVRQMGHSTPNFFPFFFHSLFIELLLEH